MALAKDWLAILNETNKNSGVLSKAAPGVMKGFSSLVGAVSRDGALDHKTKELMATAIAICVRCEGCIAYHVDSSIKAGATREEIVETIAVAVEMGGGPSTVYGSEALEAFDQLSS